MTVRELEAVVYDVDGVLLDNAAGWTRTEELLRAAYSVEYTAEIAAGTHGVGVEESIADMTSAARGEVEPTADAALLRRLAEEHVPPAALRRCGTLEAIEHIRRRIPLAIASHSERPLLEASGHADPAEVVITASDGAVTTPAPDVHPAATTLLGVPPAAPLVIEDSATGAAAAPAAGCSVVHFAPEDGTAPIPRSVGTVRNHRDLVLPLGLLARPDTDGEERP